MSLFEAQAVKELERAIAALPRRDVEFASSLVAQFRSKGHLSEKQMSWVQTLTKRASAPVQIKTEAVGDQDAMAGVHRLFDKAAEKLKRPAVVLHLPEIGDLRLSVAGAQSSQPGTINVTTDGRFGDRTWFGRIYRDGTFEHSRRQDVPAEVTEKLKAFAVQPAETAAEHGRLTGRCCFCDKGLKDDRSTDVGYGPVCAERWGLPWGTSKAQKADLFS